MKINDNTAKAVTIPSTQTASVYVKEDLSENKYKKGFP